MPAAKLPADEAQRLVSLRSLDILDSAAESGFDALVEAASLVCGAPIALLGLMDAERQWIKASVGMAGITEVPRAETICTHTILGDDLLEIADATCDWRVADNPAVRRDGGVRFYAAVPLRLTDGSRIGTLCVAGPQPRRLDDRQRAVLRRLGQTATAMIEERRTRALLAHASQDLAASEQRLRRQADLFERASEATGIGGWELDLATGELYWTNQTRRIHGLPEEYRPSLDTAIDFYAPEARPVLRAAVERCIAGGGGWDLELPFTRATGERIWVRAVGAATFVDGKPVRLNGAFKDITDRVAEREALEMARERVALATESAGNAVWDWDVRTNAQIWDDSMFRLYGRPRELGPPDFDSWLLYLHPDDIAATQAALAEALSGRRRFDVEFRIKRDFGGLHHIRAAAHVIRDAEGRPVRMVGINWDVTEARRLAAERDTKARLLAEREASFRLLAENASDMISHVAADGTRLYVSPAVERIFGVSPEEFIAGDAHRFFYPEDVATTRAWQRDMLAGLPGATIATIRVRNPHRGDVFVEVSARVIRDLAGKPAGYISITRDVTERTRYEAALLRANQRFALAADAAGIGVWDWDIQNNTLSWDEWMFRLYGRSADDGVQPYELWAGSLHPDDKERSEKHLFAAVSGAALLYDTEFRIRRPDGQIRYIKAAGAVRRDADGRAINMSGINFDITERKHAEQEMQRLVAELKRINAEMESFAYIAAHDLKAPIRGIRFLVGAVAEDLGDAASPDIRESLHLIESRIGRMTALVDDLLEYARSSRSDGEIVAVDTQALVEDIFDLAANDKAIRLHIGERLPVLQTRRAPLAMVLRNLIGNAIKHHDKPHGTITVSARATGEGTEFAVQDDGPGIAPEHQARVFGMFQTLKSRDEVEGSGLGLAIVKKAVEAAGGRITLDSDGRQGSTFRFTWPGHATHAATDATARAVG
jgi:PAS domain S-box-containing protein